MSYLNKKGIAPATIGELILVIAAGIVILWIVLAIVGFVSPTASSVGCGLNIRVRSATLDSSKNIIGSPILMCGQYNTPVDINAANFKACPGIADFCTKTKDKNVLLECWKQCARIQINQLTDSCWTMAGSGRLNLKDSYLEKLGGVLSNPVVLGVVAFTGGAAYFIIGPYTAALAVGGELLLGTIFSNGGAKILRCYRFRIVNPLVFNKQPINYFDNSLGRSWSYGLNSTNLMSTKLCQPTETNPMCSFGGYGVGYINDLGEAKYKINDKDITVPTDAQQTYAGSVLTYNITDAKSQVCYIAYYQVNGETKISYKYDDHGTTRDGEVSIGDKYVIRSCDSWSAYVGGASYLN